MNAVMAYARYSCDRQTEQSIAGQLRDNAGGSQHLRALTSSESTSQPRDEPWTRLPTARSFSE